MHRLFLCVLIIVFSASHCASKRCRRATERCDFGNGTSVSYDSCLQLCCGQDLYDRDSTFYDCCGGSTDGIMYDADSQKCCEYPQTQTYKLYNKTGPEDEGFCCGTDVYTWDEYPHTSCCSGWNTAPEPFNTLTSMCCQGRVSFITTTAYSDCCHDVAYDRRFSSCPCHNGKLLPIKRWQGECCRYGDDQLLWNPYNKRTQDCCFGQVYDKETQFCCNGIIGEAATDFCCNGLIRVHDDPTQAGNANMSCCVVGGTEVAFDSELRTCCGNQLFDAPTEGDTCCIDRPYFTETGNCCNNTVLDSATDGDGCCYNQPYDTASGVCCGQGVVESNSKWPACCVTQSFDAYTHTCCGSTVWDNPSDARGETSHHTRCCGDFGVPESLYPYDYDIETCCNGNNASLVTPEGEAFSSNYAECCGDAAMSRDRYLCCNDVVALNPYGEYGRCYENSSYDIRLEIYCEGIQISHGFGEFAECCAAEAYDNRFSLCCEDTAVIDKDSESTECCGSDAIDSEQYKCCDGVPRELNGIAKNRAVCCGDACIDGGDYWCCEGKAYWRGANNDGEDIKGLTCKDFFKPGSSVKSRKRGKINPDQVSGFVFGAKQVVKPPSGILAKPGGPPTRRPKLKPKPKPTTTTTTTTATTTTTEATEKPKKRKQPRRRRKPGQG